MTTPNTPATIDAGSTALTTWQDQLKKYAVAAVESEQPAGQFFSIKSGVLSFSGTPIPNNQMDVIVLASLHENVWYRDRFNPDKPSGPPCFAFSFTGKDMRPHDLSPEKQSPDGCDKCEKNKWGSDPQGGRGKACKNVRRLALMAAAQATTPEGVAKAIVGYLRVPVTSVQNYGRLVSQIAARNLPPFGVITRVKVVPDAKTQVRVEFEPMHSITDAGILQALISRHEVENRLIDFPYQAGQDDDSASKPSHQQPAAAPAAPSKF